MNTFIKNIETKLIPSKKTVKKVIKKIRQKIRQKVKKDGLKSLTIGISGGLDSSVVAAICQEKYTGVPLIGISIPISSSIEHKEQAKWIGKKYCSSFKEFKGWDRIGKNKEIYNEIFEILEETNIIAKKAGFKTDDFPKNILQGNMKARLRMITLYDMARKTDGMVLSTDNQSEYNMGFWTICGDVGDYGPIQNIGKGYELPELAKALGIREDIIFQSPSDGLMVTEDNTDEAQLGASYKEVDMIMYVKDNFDITKNKKAKKYLKRKKSKNIINRFNNTEFKRIGTVNLTREEIGI